MALTRKMLAAMDIPAEKIDEIISAHSETVNAIKTERDELKAAADRLPAVEKDLEKANAELETFRSGDWEKKYTDLKSEYEGFKTDTAKKAEKETRMISVHGNKTVLSGVIACCVSLVMVLSSIVSLRRVKLRLCEKEVSVELSELEKKNQKEISNTNLDFIQKLSGVEK